MSDMNVCRTCIYDGHEMTDKGKLGDLGKEMVTFNFFFNFSRAPLPPRENLKNKLTLTISLKDLGPT